MNGKKNMRRISVLVTAQTAYNLDKLAAMCGYRERGHVIDKLVREKMLQLNGGKRHEQNENRLGHHELEPRNWVPPWVPILLRQTDRPPI